MRISDWSSDVCSSDLGQRCACSICFRRDAELLHQCQRLIIYRGVVPDHLSSAQAPTALFLAFARACLPAAMSICPAVSPMFAIWASFGCDPSFAIDTTLISTHAAPVDRASERKREG